jgi:hypothetical protein
MKDYTLQNISYFINRKQEAFAGTMSAYKSNKGVYIIQSYSKPIGLIIQNTLFINVNKYSKTTSRHQNILLNECFYNIEKIDEKTINNLIFDESTRNYFILQLTLNKNNLQQAKKTKI